LPLVNLTSHSCSVENNREQTITKELRSRWKKVTCVRVVLAYFCQAATWYSVSLAAEDLHLWKKKQTNENLQFIYNL